MGKCVVLTGNYFQFSFGRKEQGQEILEQLLSIAAYHCTALHCTALHCVVLRCTALNCTALHCTELHCTVRH